MKILKLIFNNEAKWETIKPLVEGKIQFVHGFLPRPITGNYQSFSVDLLVEDSFNTAIVETYLSPLPKVGYKFRFRVTSSEPIPIEFTKPDSTWLKDDLISVCDKWGISYSASWTKSQLVDAIDTFVFFN